MSVKGTVEKVWQGEGKKGKFGLSYSQSITIDGNRYGGFSKKSLEQLGIEEGSVVKFETTENGEYVNCKWDTIQVAEASEVKPHKSAAPSSSPSPRVGSGNAGIRAGMSINNAVSAFCHGQIREADILPFARKVLKWTDTIQAELGG